MSEMNPPYDDASPDTPNCAGGAADGHCPAPGEHTDAGVLASDRRAKTAVFTVVLLLALGVGGYSWSARASNAAENPAPPLTTLAAVPDAQFRTGDGLAPVSPADGSASCGVRLESLQHLSVAASGKDVVFILMRGDSTEDAGRAIAGRVEGVVHDLTARGKRVEAFTLEQDAGGHDWLAGQLRLHTFPAVAVLGRGCSSSGIEGNVTQARLLRAFVLASTPATACSTGAAPADRGT